MISLGIQTHLLFNKCLLQQHIVWGTDGPSEWIVFTLGFLQLLWNAGLYLCRYYTVFLVNRLPVEILFLFLWALGSFCGLIYYSWIRLFCATVILLFPNINLHDRLLWMFQKCSYFPRLVFQNASNSLLVLLVEPQSYFVCTFSFIEPVLKLAIWFVSIVTEQANHARDHLKTEANLDKYDGWVLRLDSCCFQAFNPYSSPWHGVNSCLFIFF